MTSAIDSQQLSTRAILVWDPEGDEVDWSDSPLKEHPDAAVPLPSLRDHVDWLRIDSSRGPGDRVHQHGAETAGGLALIPIPEPTRPY